MMVLPLFTRHGRGSGHAWRMGARFAGMTSDIQLVKLGRGAAEQRGLLLLRRAGGQALEAVPADRVAVAALVYRKVALEHAAVGAEGVDAGFDIGLPGRCQRLRRRRVGRRLEAEAVDAHPEAAELDEHVAACR